MQSFLSQTAAPPAVYSAFETEFLIPFDHSDLNTAVPFTEDVRTTIKIGSGSYIYHPIIDSKYSSSQLPFFQIVSGFATDSHPTQPRKEALTLIVHFTFFAQAA